MLPCHGEIKLIISREERKAAKGRTHQHLAMHCTACKETCTQSV